MNDVYIFKVSNRAASKPNIGRPIHSFPIDHREYKTIENKINKDNGLLIII